MWFEPFDSMISNSFKLQSEIAATVASSLDVAILQPEKHSLDAKLTENSAAYDLYLRAMSYYDRGYDEQDYRSAAELFQRAVEADPRFTVAYARMAEVHANLFWDYYDHSEARVALCYAA